MEKKTKYGLIEIDDRVLSKIIKDSIKKAEGKVILHDKKGNLEISCDEEIDISFDVDVKFGSSIKENTDTILNEIQSVIEPMKLGKKINLTLNVKGMVLNKGNIVDRDIEIIREF